MQPDVVVIQLLTDEMQLTILTIRVEWAVELDHFGFGDINRSTFDEYMRDFYIFVPSDLDL